MTLSQLLARGAKQQAPKAQAPKAQAQTILTLAQLQKQSRQLFFPFPVPRTKR